MLFDLKKASKSISNYADVLSNVLKVDVEIVDFNLNRIASTSRYNQIRNSVEGDVQIFKKVIKTGQMLVIEKPGFDEVCVGCSKHKHCDETFEMSTPIIYEGVTVGAIGLICFDDEQKVHFLKNYTIFREFLEQISDMIVSKVVERMDYEKNRTITKLLKVIFETIEDGILVINENNRIINHNKKAKEILSIEDSYLNGEEIEVIIGNTDSAQTQLILKINDQTYQSSGVSVPLSIDGYYRVVILKEDYLNHHPLESPKIIADMDALEGIVGQSPQMVDLKDKVHMIALSDSTVLITGESGTGKELFARAIHDASSRRDKAFVAVNCGALPEHLIESELFGYAKGAFTGADPAGKDGKFVMANGGTIFLDEIGEMPLHLQVKILRVLEEREVSPLGSLKSKKLNIRVIAATNKQLSVEVKEKRFREDLYYRLNVIPIKLPALRERKSDLRLLSLFFLKRFEVKLQKNIEKIDISFWERIEAYEWPGNVRELQNVMEYALNMVGQHSVLTAEHLPQSMLVQKMVIDEGMYHLERIEKMVIEGAMKKYGNFLSKNEIANVLGIGIATLYRKLGKYDL